MSRIVLSGNASGTGTITIAAPNTNADVTINLPVDGGALPYQSALTSYTPVVTSSTGVIATYTSSGSYVKTGRLVTFFADVNITSRGTGSGTLLISLPFLPSRSFACSVYNVQAVLPYAASQPGQNTVGLLNYSNSSIIQTGFIAIVTGTYATAS